MKEKYEDLIYRVVSKNYPYVKKITFTTVEDDPDLTVTVHIDTDMLSPHIKDVSEPEDYVHHLFNYSYYKVIRDDSYRLDKLIHTLTSPFTKLIPTNDDDPFISESFIQYLKYDNVS